MILDARTADEKLMGGTTLSTTHVEDAAIFTRTALKNSGDFSAMDIRTALDPLLAAVPEEALEDFNDALGKVVSELWAINADWSERLLDLFEEELLARLEDVESPHEGR